MMSIWRNMHHFPRCCARYQDRITEAFSVKYLF